MCACCKVIVLLVLFDFDYNLTCELVFENKNCPGPRTLISGTMLACVREGLLLIGPSWPHGIITASPRKCLLTYRTIGRTDLI